MNVIEKIELRKSGKLTDKKIIATENGANCNQCPYKYQPIVFPELPNGTKEVAIIGSAPSRNEIRRNKIHVGQGGKILDAVLKKAGYTREDFYLTNLVLCKSTSKDIDREAIKCCAPRLKQELSLVDIRKAVTLGADTLLNSSKDRTNLNHALNTEIDSIWEGIKIVPSYSPSFVLHRPNSITDIENTFKQLNTGLPIPNIEYEQITLDTLDKVQAFVDSHNPNLLCVVDLETTNRDMINSLPDIWWEGYILSCAFYFGEDYACVVTEEMMNNPQVLELLKPIFERVQGIAGHNLKFDIKYLYHYYKHEINIKLADDSMLMSYTLEEEKGKHSLKKCAALVGDANYDDVLDKYLKNKNQSYSAIPRDVLYEYNIKDVVYCWHIIKYFTCELKKQNLYWWPYKNVLLEVQFCLIQTELGGMFIQADRAAASSKKLNKQVKKLKKKLQDLSSNENLNPNSVPQLNTVIYKDMGLGKKKLKKGTSKEVIEKLLAINSDNEFLLTLTKYRRYTKLLNTYVNKLPLLTDEYGQYHANYNTIGTVTGRLSAGTIMTIPRSYTQEGALIRSQFGIPTGKIPPHMKDTQYVLIDADYSQAELRWLGFLSGDEFLYEVYLNGQDLHTQTAIVVYGNEYLNAVEQSKVNPDKSLREFFAQAASDMRTNAKTLNFSYAYGGTEHTLVAQGKMRLKEARKALKKHKETLIGAEQWKAYQWKTLKSQGYLESITGRRRRFPFIPPNKAKDIRNAACNFPVQAIASDCTLLAYEKLTKLFTNMAIYPCMFFHDGIYFLCEDKKDTISYAKEEIAKTMLETALELQALARLKFDYLAQRPDMPIIADVEIKEFWK